MALEVELQAFDGPLDLLLSLIEKNKINIFDIPIVEITDQYLAYVQAMEEENLDVMSEFMVMAAELIAIKCRLLLPKDEEKEEDEADPRDELIQRLLEYKTYKYMSYELKDRMEDYTGRIFKGDSTPQEVRKFRPEVNVDELVDGLTLEKLHTIFDAVLRRQADKIDPMRSRFGTIEREEVSLPEKLESVAQYAKKHKNFSFRDLLKKQGSRTQLVVTFLAVLSLISYGLIRVTQEGIGDDIEIEQVPEADLAQIRTRFEESEFDEEGAEDGREGDEN